MNTRSTTTLEVEIFGETYHVRGDNDPEYLQELAALVDAKMTEVAAHLKTVDRTKIAILAALNVADDLVRCRKDQGGGTEVVNKKISKLTGDLNEALRA